MADTASSTMMPHLIHDPLLLWLVTTAPLATLCVVVVLVWYQDLGPEERRHSALIGALALAVLWPSARHALNMQVSPDSVEYGVAAFQLWKTGAYEISLHGEQFPPRYPFGFSAFVLLPFLRLFASPHPGMGIFGVSFLTALGAPSAYILGRRIHSASAGLLASAVYILLPGLALSAQELLTQAPAAGLWLVIGSLYIARPVGPLAHSRALGIGLAGFTAAACRPLAGALLATIALGAIVRRERATAIFLLIGPSAALVIGYLIYNTAIFGNPLRSGYHYWCAIPYDFFSLTFHPRYLGSNLVALWNSGCIGLLILAALGGRTPPQQDVTRQFKKAAYLAIFTTVAVHLLYFYKSELFFLPVAALLAVPAAAGIVSFGQRAGMRWSILQAALTLGLGAILIRVALVLPAQTQNARINFVEIQLSSLPPGSILITGLNPAFVEAQLSGDRRIEILPISRQVEYADKVVVHRKLALPVVPGSPSDHRSLLLPPGQFEEVYRTVALESLPRLTQALRAGRAIFLDARFTSSTERREIGRQFNTIFVAPGLLRLGILAPSP